MIYTTGYKIKENWASVSQTLCAVLAATVALLLWMWTDVPWLHAVRAGLQYLALFAFCFSIVLVISAFFKGREEKRKDREEWERIGETAGYAYWQNRVDPNLRRAEYIVMGENRRASEHPLNRRWLDQGGEFDARDLQFELR